MQLRTGAHALEARLAEPELQGWDARRALLEVVTTLLPPYGVMPTVGQGQPLLSVDFMVTANLDLARIGAGIGWGPCRPVASALEIRQRWQAGAQYASTVGSSAQNSSAVDRVARTLTEVELAIVVNDRDYDTAFCEPPAQLPRPPKMSSAMRCTAARARGAHERSGSASG
jgi:hypothetical protein